MDHFHRLRNAVAHLLSVAVEAGDPMKDSTLLHLAGAVWVVCALVLAVTLVINAGAHL